MAKLSPFDEGYDTEHTCADCRRQIAEKILEGPPATDVGYCTGSRYHEGRGRFLPFQGYLCDFHAANAQWSGKGPTWRSRR